MTDLEMIKKCAEKMGMKPDGLATKSVAYKVSHCSILAIGRIRTLERKFTWLMRTLLTLDAEVNRQIEFYLGRHE